ncbi:carbohydrate-binding module family 12 protein [Gigaspora margarita]|uniref:Carbohydrate-binding module family 12 protein n=1 Tax=Gigaspora margarita TaxID=4874 RepID=A0A8H4AMI5_GIGMA|nr:carbohydrate-binding module family 12 protein [Gigaspora margarita]
MAEFSSEKEHQTEKNQSIKSIQWVTSQSGKVPEKAYIFHGKVIGRGVYNHGVHIGYIDTSEGGLIIGWAGCKVLLHKYQVLVAENVELMWIKISGRLQITGVKAGSENVSLNN